MRKIGMGRPVFSLASAITLLALACAKQLPLTEILNEPNVQCDPAPLMSAVRVLAWACSDQGRTVVMATIAAIAALSFLAGHHLPEAREFAIAGLILVAMLFVAAAQSAAGSNPKVCAQLSAKLAGHGNARP